MDHHQPNGGREACSVTFSGQHCDWFALVQLLVTTRAYRSQKNFAFWTALFLPAQSFYLERRGRGSRARGRRG